MTKAIKEIIIMLLVCLVTMLVLAIALYQYIPSKKEVPEIEKYVASEEVQDLLEDNVEDRSNNEKKDAVLVLTSTDLKNYQKTYDYVPGKANPFAVYAPTVEGEATQPEGGENTSNSTTTGTSTNTSQGTQNSEYYQNTSTK